MDHQPYSQPSALRVARRAARGVGNAWVDVVDYRGHQGMLHASHPHNLIGFSSFSSFSSACRTIHSLHRIRMPIRTAGVRNVPESGYLGLKDRETHSTFCVRRQLSFKNLRQ